MAKKHSSDIEHKLYFTNLSESRDKMTSLSTDNDVRCAVDKIFEEWRKYGTNSEPLNQLRKIVETLRLRDRSIYRLKGMNTLVHCLGRRERLAEFLDILRLSINNQNEKEKKLALISQQGKWHSIYGWTGTTFVTLSDDQPVKATSQPKDDKLNKKLEYPLPLWWMSVHVWQPNGNALGFPSGKRSEPNLIVEPPHSHPFDFVSIVSKGSIRQSIYRPKELATKRDSQKGRYDSTILMEVDGVWPPHTRERPARLETIENQVLLSEGDSYFLPYNVIHDVEVSKNTASSTPAVTLFFASESIDVANVYMANAMLEYHKEHPDIIDSATPMQKSDWELKLKMLSNYLRGESDTLTLSQCFKNKSSYAFFHS